MKLSIILPGLFCAFFLAAFPVFAADVAINELLPNPSSGSDWIEIYNISNSVISLGELSLKDTTGVVYEFSNTLILPAEGFCVANVSKRLNNAGDKIQLFQGTTLQDCVAYGDANGSPPCGAQADVAAPSNDESTARKPDGTGIWAVSTPTSGYSNVATTEPTDKVLCYTPTPTPPPTSAPTDPPPEPTNTPTPTRTPTPTPTPTKTPTPTPTLKPTPTIVLTASASAALSSASAVLGATDSSAPASAEADMKTKPSVKPLVISLLFVGIGCGILSLVFVWKKRDALKPPETS